MPIPRIFDALGEDTFRQLEREALGSLPSLEGFVVASGGGAFTFPDNWEAAKEHALVVFLDADFPTCYHRVKDSDRPIVRRSTPLQLEELFRSRYPLYQAHWPPDGGRLPPASPGGEFYPGASVNEKPPQERFSWGGFLLSWSYRSSSRSSNTT